MSFLLQQQLNIYLCINVVPCPSQRLSSDIIVHTAPFADIKKFNQTLSEILFKLKNNSEFKNVQDIILLEDVNINLLNHASHSDTGIYLDTLLLNGFNSYTNIK